MSFFIDRYRAWQTTQFNPLQVPRSADCRHGSAVIDLQGKKTHATISATHVYVNLWDGMISNNQCNTYTLPEADPATFVAMDQFYGKDAYSVWFIADPTDDGGPDSYQVFGADPSTFSLIPDHFLDDDEAHE